MFVVIWEVFRGVKRWGTYEKTHGEYEKLNRTCENLNGNYKKNYGFDEQWENNNAYD